MENSTPWKTLLKPQLDLISTLFSFNDSFTQPETPKPSLAQRVAQGLLGVVYVCFMLCMIMLVSVAVGVLLVNSWVDQPLFVDKSLWFDYTRVNPEASVVFGFRGGGGGGGLTVGHWFDIRVELLVPDSEYNRDIGVFQIMAEAISKDGEVIASSSKPAMLHFQSQPIRLIRTFFMGLPLVLGFAHETQKISVHVLNYKETIHSRTESIKITLMPRAGTLYLPQLYSAQIIVQSKLPRLKQLAYNWKWTLCVWTSAYIYLLLLLLVVYFYRALLVYPVSRTSAIGNRALRIVETEGESKSDTESLKNWQLYRKKRKAELFGKDDDGGASSYTVSKDEVGPSIEEDVGDSESVFKGGYKEE